MPPPTIQIDLARAPDQRWLALADQGSRINALLAACGGPALAILAEQDEVLAVVRAVMPADHYDELAGLARLAGVDERLLLLANCTYDLGKFRLGCSALAVATGRGPLHGRNLDWWAPDDALAAETLICRFINAPAGAFTTIGWPGYLGALSGVAPGRFAVTLNAAFSDDPPVPRTPVACVLRRVLEEAATYDEALATLTRTPLSTDCIIMLSGCRDDQLAVIERAPGRHAVRHAVGGVIMATNDFLVLDQRPGAFASEIHRTSCSRLARLAALAAAQPPRTPALLVFSAATGLCEVEAVYLG